MDVFGTRDLTKRLGKLFRNAQDRRLSLITNDGRPLVLAVPFDTRLLYVGTHRALALHQFEKRHLTLSQATKLTAMTYEEFIELLGNASVPAVHYPPE